MRPLTRDAYDTACNWKLAMDTFGETYHFAVLHRRHAVERLPRQRATARRGRPSPPHDPLPTQHRRHATPPEDEWSITAAALPVYWIFPDVVLMPFDAGVFLVRTYPDRDDPGRHLSRIDFYVKPDLEGLDDKVLEFISDIAHNFAEIIRDEDYVMSASQQAAANGGSLEFVLFGRNEPTLHHYHNTYRAMLGAEPSPRSSRRHCRHQIRLAAETLPRASFPFVERLDPSSTAVLR